MSHTPGPIHVGDLDCGAVYLWDEGEENFIGSASCEDVGSEACQANAHRIALCWNSHDALVKAIKTALGPMYYADNPEGVEALQAALALVGETMP